MKEETQSLETEVLKGTEVSKIFAEDFSCLKTAQPGDGNENQEL